MKEWIYRALRTFLQTFLGTLAAGLTGVVSGYTDMESLKLFVYSLLASSLAAAVAAVMNINRNKER